jgi:uncharacterized membrane protein HdeD (DUF308 family)
MTEQAKQYAQGAAPWRRGIGWPIVGFEGLLALGIGIYVLTDKSGAKDNVQQVIAAILLINGLIEVLAGFRNQGTAASPYRILRGTIGATVGFIVALEWITDYVNSEASRVILGCGLVAYSLVGLAIVVVTREEGGLRIGALIVNLVLLLIGVLLFTGDETDNSRMTFFGTILIVLGVLLLAFAAYLYRSQQQKTTPSSATGSGAPPPAPTAPTVA